MKAVFSESREGALQTLLSEVGKVLEKISLKLVAAHPFPGNEDYSIVEIAVSGEKAEAALTQLGIASWTLRWIVPSNFKKVVLSDIPGGEEGKYIYPLWLAKTAKASPVPVIECESGATQDGKDKCVFRHGSAPRLDDELNVVAPSWWIEAMGKWRAFVRWAGRRDSLGLEDLVRLESSLNGLFLSFKGREECSAREFSTEWNGLRALEEVRRLDVDWRGRQQGRVRRPHLSHEGRLCPFHTPESPRIGLQLHLAADSELEGGGISKGSAIFSAATGLIPYPLHTDGPRLLMGGKNMKQAETAIAMPEPPLVPGYFEGDKMDELRVFPSANRRERRFYPWLGRNVWVAVMPFDGYTYEDGLVVSESLVKAFSINSYVFSEKKDFRFVTLAKEYRSLGQVELARLLQKEADNRLEFSGSLLEYGDTLPLEFLESFFPPEEDGLFHCRYFFRLPAKLADINISLVLNRNGTADIKVHFLYEANLPLGFGDKITGRHGNKGVVTRIMADGERPVASIGGRDVPIDLVISPCSILGRKNLGQILEMLHGGLLWGRDEGIKGLEAVPGDRTLTPSEVREFAVPALQKSLGADEEGFFPVRLADGREVRAFAGPQYFLRLHHHCRRKLQARGADGPSDQLTGMPGRGGSRTAQKLGEMEHWSLLSYGQQGKDLLFAMRNGRAPAEAVRKTREIFSLALLALGFRVEEGESLVVRRSFPGDRRALEAEGYEVREVSVYEAEQRLKAVLAEEPGRRVLTRQIYIINSISVKKVGKSEEVALRSPGDVVFESTGKNFLPFDCEGALWLPLDLFTGRMDLAGAPKNESPATGFFRLCDGLKRWGRGEGRMDKEEAGYAGKVIRSYANLLISFLGGKEGLVRGTMMGRRFTASGRSVIVPEPSLAPDEVTLPLVLAMEMFEGAQDVAERLWNKQGGAFPEAFLPGRKEITLASDAGSLDGLLVEETVWCLMIRQPSLHRHSVQAYRVRVWEKDVIGIPPLVTPGFGADFDGDTMAVFLPPEPFAGDLSALSILENPGIVGTGDLALASDLDLALGWEALGEAGKKKFLKRAGAKYEKGLNFRKALALIMSALGGKSAEGRREMLRELQMEVCRASAGMGSLSPVSFQRLNDGFRSAFPGKDWINKALAKDGRFKERMESALRENARGAIGLLVNSGAKGGMDDLRAIGAFLGDQDIFREDEKGSADVKKRAFIPSNLWEGLTEEELFVYSYSCRDSMQAKKLAVAEAGYLSRLLAEGLFETSVTERDCGAAAGLRLSYDGATGRIALALPGMDAVDFPSKGDLAADLIRITWGRVPTGMERCLGEEDLMALADVWRGGNSAIKADLKAHLAARGGTLEIRTPLLCNTERPGLCSLCCGADLAVKPLGRTTPVPPGAGVGLTAAQAIGERGTQLAMKRFHQVSAAAEGTPKTKRLKEILIDDQNGKAPGERLAELIGILGAEGVADKDLPQALVHFEIAIRPGDGLKKEATSRAGKGFLSALSFERVGDALRMASDRSMPAEDGEGPGGLEDDFSCLKSRLLWF